MVEISISPIPRTATVGGITPGNVTSGATNVPTGLASLPAGTVLSGFVLNRDAGGNPVLRTEHGDFLIQSQLFLKIGADVVVRIAGAGQQSRAVILSVDGHAPAAPQTGNPATPVDQVVQPRGGSEYAPPQPRTAPPASGAPLSAASGGIAARNAETAAAPAQNTPRQPVFPATLQPPPNTPLGNTLLPLSVRVLGVTEPERKPSSASSPAVSTEGESEGGAQAAPTAPRAPTAAASSAYAAYGRQPGSHLGRYEPLLAVQAVNAGAEQPSPQPAASATGTSPAPPFSSAPPAPPTLPSTPTVLQATVVRTEGGTLVLASPFGEMRVQAGTASFLPPGSIITMQATPNPSPAPASATPELLPPSPSAALPPASIPELAGNWDSLQEIIDVLQQIAPDTAEAFTAAHLPNIPRLQTQPSPLTQNAQQAFSGGLFVFLQALKGGDFRQWLGEDATRKLEEKGYGQLLSRAESEFNNMRTLYNNTQHHQPWQAMFLPFMTPDGMHMARWFTKRQPRDESRRQPREDTRFVVEVNFSTLGELQMDGLVQFPDAPTNPTRFDLVVRSDAPLPPETQAGIAAIYHGTGEATGYLGTLQFQDSRDFPVRPLEEILGASHAQGIA